jgi:putative DNA primase/helicase
MIRKKTKQKKAIRSAAAKGETKPNREVIPSYKDLTDLGNGERLIDKYGSVIRYCPESKQLHVYDGKRWKPDSGQVINTLAADVARCIPREAQQPGLPPDEVNAILKHAKKSAARSSMKAMIEVAKWFPSVTVHLTQLDVDPWLLNCQNGTLDLRTGELKSHNPFDLITKVISVPYDPEALCPLWDNTISKLMGNDPAKVSFLQRMAGYLLTGDTSEQCLFVFHGPGSNGKTTILEVFRELMAEYARHTTTASLLQTTASLIRNDLARLDKTRLVTAVEVGMGKRLDEALVKQLTGGDQVTARFLYKEFFEFKPEFKLIIAANHKPDIRGVDHGIWRRIHLIPFDVIIPREEIDKDLPAKLRNELPGILAWAVRGCREWLEGGLMVPDSIAAATAEYRHEMDVLENFFEDKCIKAADKRAPVGLIYSDYEKWCSETCQDAVGKKIFGNLMRQKGYSQAKSGGVRYWHGLELQAQQSTPA